MNSAPAKHNMSLLLQLGLPLPLLNELQQYDEVDKDQSCWDNARNIVSCRCLTLVLKC
jgi:hypothetical protein